MLKDYSVDVQRLFLEMMLQDAVKCNGRLVTLIHIMQARETSKIKIELRKRQLAKRS